MKSYGSASPFLPILLDFPPIMEPWWGVPGGTFWFFGLVWLWMLILWGVFIVVGLLIYEDAEKHGMNGLLWLILIIVAPVTIIIYHILREEKGKSPFSKESAQEILDRRYARGEITRKEYRQMKKELKESKE